jgi:hypothetical protein
VANNSLLCADERARDLGDVLFCRVNDPIEEEFLVLNL